MELPDFNYHLRQLSQQHAEVVDWAQGQCILKVQLQEQKVQLQEEVVRLRGEVERLRGAEPSLQAHHAAAPSPEPYTSDRDLRTGLNTGAHWVRLAQGTWHRAEALLQLDLASRQQIQYAKNSVEAQSRQCHELADARLQQARELVHTSEGACAAAQAYQLLYAWRTDKSALLIGRGIDPTEDLMLSCSWRTDKSAMWKAAAAALRNNVTMHLLSMAGSCSYKAFKDMMEEVYLPGRVGTQGYDLDLRSQLLNSFAHIFPGIQREGEKKRKRTRVKKNVDSPSDGSEEALVPNTTLGQESGWTLITEARDQSQDEKREGGDVEMAEVKNDSGRWVTKNTFLDWEDDSASQGKGSHKSNKSCPPQLGPSAFSYQKDSSSILGQLRAEMPAVSEECEPPKEALLAYAREFKRLGKPLNTLLNTLLDISASDGDSVQMVQLLLTEFKSNECMEALWRFISHSDQKQANELIMLLVDQLEKASEDKELQTICLDILFWTFRNLEWVFSLAGARSPDQKVQSSDELRSKISKVVGPMACSRDKADMEGEMSRWKKAIRILARSLPLAQLLHAIEGNAESLQVALEEVFYNIHEAIKRSYDEDPTYTADKEWGLSLLRDLMKQRQDIADPRSERVFIQFIKGKEFESHCKSWDRCILLGLLFPTSVLVGIFRKAVGAVDQVLMAALAQALQFVNDSFQPLCQEQCDGCAEAALTVDLDQSHLQRFCRTDMVNMLGSVICNSSNDDLCSRALKQITCSARVHAWDERGVAFDYAVVWALQGFMEKSNSWPRLASLHSNDVADICKKCESKWSKSQEKNAGKAVLSAQKILQMLVDDADDA